jgi:PPOX class probable F420-dependent enzyme
MAKANAQDFSDLFKKRSFAHLTTMMSDGSPHASPVWVDFDGRHVIINSAKGRVKDKNMRRDPRVAISIQDPDNPGRFIGIRGQVVDITENGADTHIDAMAKKYLDVDKYPYKQPGEIRVLYKIRPDHCFTM